MNTIKCCIIDDEPVARKILREYIQDIDFLELAGEAENPIKASTLLSQTTVDLLFVDIQMPRMNGIDFMKTLHPSCNVIITTAYPEYALQGFELNAIDYLVKPIGFERFLRAANKASEYHFMKRSQQDHYSLRDFFFIKCGQKIEKIMMDEVIYVEGLANYVILHTCDKQYITYITFKGIEEKLPKDRFIRIHKSYLVSLNAINCIEGNELKLNKIALPISKYYKEEVMMRIERSMFRRD
jgi:DNA-binding LytR/AlgR family response regulator